VIIACVTKEVGDDPGVYFKAGMHLLNSKINKNISCYVPEQDTSMECKVVETDFAFSTTKQCRDATTAMCEKWASDVVASRSAAKEDAYIWVGYLRRYHWAELCGNARNTSYQEDPSVSMGEEDEAKVYLFTHCVFVLSDYGFSTIPAKKSHDLFEMANVLLDAMTTNNGKDESESLRIAVSVAMELLAELALCMQFSENIHSVVVSAHPAKLFKMMHEELIVYNEGNQLKYEFGKTTNDQYVRQHHYLLYYWLRATLEDQEYQRQEARGRYAKAMSEIGI